MSQVFQNLNTFNLEGEERTKIILWSILSFVIPTAFFVLVSVSAFAVAIYLEPAFFKNLVIFNLTDNFFTEENMKSMFFNIMPVAVSAFVAIPLCYVVAFLCLRRLDMYRFESRKHVEFYNIAPLNKRVLARFFDYMSYVSVSALWWIGSGVAAVKADQNALEQNTWMQVIVIAGFLMSPHMGIMTMGVLNVILEGLTGKTFGKWVVRLKVVKTDASKIGFGAAVLRTVLTFIDTFFYGLVAYIIMVLSPANQRLGDYVAKTVVIEDKKKASAFMPELAESQI